MFAKRIGGSVRQPLNRIVSVNHALINRFIHINREPLSLDHNDTEQRFYRGIDIYKFGNEGLLEDPDMAKQLLCPPLISVHGSYHEAVIASRKDFMDRVVLNVGAASEVLSLCAAEAGARHVYTVEADFLRAKVVRDLVARKPTLAERITIIEGKTEKIELPEKADILISEGMGSLLLCKTSLKDYVIARDRFLSPIGKSFPSIGRIQMAPFTDASLFNKIADRPVYNVFDPNVMVAGEMSHMINFKTLKEGDVPEINFPFKFTACLDATVHGLTFCYDVYFGGSTVTKWLTTSHGSPSPLSQHVQCLLSKPIHVMAGQEITGRLHLVGNGADDYTIYLTMSAEQDGDLHTSSAKLDFIDAWDMSFAKDAPPDSWYSSDWEGEPTDHSFSSESEGEPTDYLVDTQTTTCLNEPDPNWRKRVILEGLDYLHWMIVMEFDQEDPKPSEEEMIDKYVKTLAQVVGSEEEAKKKIYSVYTTKYPYTGFGALISIELSKKVKGLPGVLHVVPDSYLDVQHRDYGGDLYIDGEVIRRPPNWYEMLMDGPCRPPSYPWYSRNINQFPLREFAT